MNTARFLQVHTLHSYPAALLNRDDSGLAKRLLFGDAVRTRISSQCLKRHWRVAQDEFSLSNIAGSTPALRSRNIVERKVIAPLRETGDFNEEVLKSVEDAFNIGVYGKSGTSESGRQPLLLGLPEVEHLHQRASAICAEHPGDPAAAGEAAATLFRTRHGEGTNFRALLDTAQLPSGLESALFGRMITSDPGSNIEAAIHVAHAFTVHREESESDYFSVVDDLQMEDEDPGAAHIGSTELTAGLFYGYVVVDVPGLVSNLEGCPPDEWEGADRELAGNVINNLLHLIATVPPARSWVRQRPTPAPTWSWSKRATGNPAAWPTPTGTRRTRRWTRPSGGCRSTWRSWTTPTAGGRPASSYRWRTARSTARSAGAWTTWRPGPRGQSDRGGKDDETPDNSPGIAADVLRRRDH